MINNPSIYVYDIEPNYNSNLFPVYISNDDIIYKDDSNIINNSSQYSLEIKIHTLIKNYNYKSDNIENCDLIFIPIYTFLVAWQPKFVYNLSNIIESLNKIKPFIEKYSKIKKILLVYSDVMWEDERCFINHFSFNENVHFVCYENVTSTLNKQIPIPFVTQIYKNPDEYEIPIYKQKKNLICYCGRFRKEQNYIKNMVILDLCKYQTVPEQWISINNSIMYDEINQLYLNSIFSLQPHGDKQTRKGFYHSILLGCIPVVFENNLIAYKNVFSNIIDIEDICIIIKNDEINLIEEILSKIDENKIKNIILNFNKVKKILLYYDKNMEILYNIFSKINF